MAAEARRDGCGRPDHLASIQAVRAVAAWAVVFAHTLSVARGVSGGNAVLADLYSQLGVFAHAGVDAFFVVSGAIMVILYGSDKDEPRIASTLRFLFSRALLCIVATVFIVATASLYSHRPFERPLMSGVFVPRRKVPSIG